MIKIAPSIIAGNMADLKSEIIRVMNDADLIHLDIMDGHFVPNITFGFSTVKALRKYTSLPFDAHLMIKEPLKYIDNFIEAGCDIISVHLEVCNKDILYEIINKVKNKNKKIGIALNPDTELPNWIIDMLDEFYLINIMSVYPGFSGQKLIPRTLEKMARINKMLRELNKDIIIEADGGIDVNNIADVVKSGAKIIVAGNGVYGNADVAKAIIELRAKAMLAIKEAI